MAGLPTGAILGAAAINSATSGGTSSGGSSGTSYGNSQSISNTYGTAASNLAAERANSANEAANAAWQKMADFNAAEAQKARDWNERMANTVYQRTVKDMIAAGINPVLAAGMGLGSASISSGAQATAGNPMTFMPNTYADSQSASVAHNESENSSYQQSVSGLAYLADVIGNAITNMTSGHNITVSLEGLKDVLGDKDDKTGDGKTDWEDTEESIIQAVENVTGVPGTTFRDFFMTPMSPKRQSMENNLKNDNPAMYKSPGRINESTW